MLNIGSVETFGQTIEVTPIRGLVRESSRNFLIIQVQEFYDQRHAFVKKRRLPFSLAQQQAPQRERRWKPSKPAAGNSQTTQVGWVFLGKLEVSDAEIFFGQGFRAKSWGICAKDHWKLTPNIYHLKIEEVSIWWIFLLKWSLFIGTCEPQKSHLAFHYTACLVGILPGSLSWLSIIII